MSPIQPIQHCYWVSPRLLAGEYPRNDDEASSQDKIKALITAGISTFVDLTEEQELKPYQPLLPPYPDIAYHRFPIRDVSIPTSPDLTKAILDTIDQAIAQEKTVYVHCWGGVGRTGLIVGCWLARHDGQGGKAALRRLRGALWPNCPKSATRSSPETSDQEKYIQEWRERTGT